MGARCSSTSTRLFKRSITFPYAHDFRQIDDECAREELPDSFQRVFALAQDLARTLDSGFVERHAAEGNLVAVVDTLFRGVAQELAALASLGMTAEERTDG